jgi:hypothetical protein
MAEIVTKEQLENASLDAESLEIFVSGPDNEDVLTRLGRQYPTLAKAVKKVENIGGYISVANITALNAIVPEFDHQVARTDDTGDEYRWNPTATPTPKWEPTGRNFSKETKEYVDEVSGKISEQKVAEFIVKTPSKILHAFCDVNGDVYSFYDEDGHLYATDLPDSVQNEILSLKEKTSLVLTEEESDLYHLVDKDGNLVSKVDKDGLLYLTGIDSSVQDYLININTNTGTLSAPKTYKTLADLYSPETLNCLNSNDVKAPIGRGLLPQQYYLGKEWLKHLSAPVSPERIVIGAYNDKGTATNWVPDSGVVHPNLIKFDQPLCGYKYWMGINPYTNTNEDYELPYIYGSNSDNLDSWTLIPDFPQPFDVDPPDTGGVLSGHLSDSCFTYDTVNAELWFFWRQTRYYSADRNRANATNTFVGRKTKDGTNWSDIITIYPTYTINNDLKLSPAIIHNPKDGLFYLYYINLNGSMSCEVTENLSHPSWRKIADIQVPFTAWHLEIKWVGSALVALIHSDTVDQLFVGTSTDMKNWEWSAGVFNAATNLYKSSFLPVFNDNNQVSLKIVYTTDQNSTPKWQLHTTQTNFTNIEA